MKSRIAGVVREVKPGHVVDAETHDDNVIREWVKRMKGARLELRLIYVVGRPQAALSARNKHARLSCAGIL